MSSKEYISRTRVPNPKLISMKKIVTFGEILLRLTPVGYNKIQQGRNLVATFGGSETNVAVSLAHFGLNSDFVTCLPHNDVANAAICDLRSHGVGVDNIATGGARVGLYYYENTSAMRPAKVVYDRAGSSFATSSPSDYNWERAFQGAQWFHWSGIGPSLSESAANVTKQAITKAQSMGLTISADLNFRKNLWKYGKSAEEVMPALAQECDVLFGTEGEYEKAFGVKPVAFEMTDPTQPFNVDEHKAFCQAIRAKAPKCKKIFVALRNVIDAKHHVFVGLLMTQDGSFYVSKAYKIDPVVDCVGCGDAFAAGLIYGVISYPDDNQTALEYATAAAVLKNTMTGDYNLSSADEVVSLMNGNGSGRIAR